MRNVILFNSFEQAIKARKDASTTLKQPFAQQASDSPAFNAAFNTVFTTPHEFLNSSWDLWGNNKQIIDSKSRIAYLVKALQDTSAFEPTVGCAEIFAKFIQWSSGFDFAQIKPKETEIKFLEVIGHYYQLIDANNLIEPGNAAKILQDTMSHYSVKLSDGVEVPPAFQQLIDVLNNNEGAPAKPPSNPQLQLDTLDCSNHLRFFFSMAPLASSASILQEIKQLTTKGCKNFVACCADPQKTFNALSGKLAQEGFACQLHSTEKFTNTNFGISFNSAYGLMAKSNLWVEFATDFAYSKYSGMSSYEACKFNTELRHDRLHTPEDAVEMLDGLSPTFSSFHAFFNAVNSQLPQMAVALKETLTTQFSSISAVDCAAIDGLLTLAETCCNVGLSMDYLVELTHSLNLSGNYASTQDCDLNVRFTTLASMKNLPAASFDAVIIEDATSYSFASSTKTNSLNLFASKLNIPEKRTSDAEQLVAFNAAIASSLQYFSCGLILNDDNKNANYSTLFLDELIAKVYGGQEEFKYRDKDKFNIPKKIVAASKITGEGNFTHSISSNFEAVDCAFELPQPTRGQLENAKLIDFLYTVDELENRLPVLSPSAIEEYISCPYRWFINRKIKPEDIDEGFSAVEKGTFSHYVLQRFYEGLPADLGGRLNSEWIKTPAAVQLYETTFNSCLERQPLMEPQSGRLVPLNASEQTAIKQIKIKLWATIQTLSKLPAQYKVHSHEFQIGLDDAVGYAGARIIGRVDRIDVAPELAKFAVLDYKGSISGHNAGYSIAASDETFELPSKVQALIYAKCMKEIFNRQGMCISPSCAAYITYLGKQPKDTMLGSIDEAAYCAPAFANKKSAVDINFDEFLDIVENVVSESVQSLIDGNIGIDPKSNDACKYCIMNSQCQRSA